jgi:serine/tyrosine/threonine adenylyltransferase
LAASTRLGKADLAETSGRHVRSGGVSIAPETSVAFQHRFADELPELAVHWRAEEAPEPRLLVLNEPLAGELGFDPAWLRSAQGVRLLVGDDVPTGAVPVAQGYSGHQFGGFVPRLGDGRALLVGELVDQEGHLRDLHLKGSGRTPFARGGDGLAVVGPMLREYVISEAMHALGVPTTRSLAVVATGRPVRRESVLPGAVLARVASSHLRVGSFQYARSSGDRDLLARLADHAITRHHPRAAEAEHPYRALFESVIAAQATLVAQWMLVGFIHGVMNTDNMTISGETIDYGPCAFMDAFDPATVFSSIDHSGRYAYGNQPVVAEWNLARLAEAMLPLLHDDEEQAVAVAVESLGGFRSQYSAAWSAGMAGKLGLSPAVDDGARLALVDDLIGLLREGRVDWTGSFRALGAAARGDTEPARGLFVDLAAFDAWVARWLALGPDPEAMDRTNPVYVPRNHLVEEALDAATAGDLDPLHRLLDAGSTPYGERPGLERYAGPAPEDFGGGYQTFCGT